MSDLYPTHDQDECDDLFAQIVANNYLTDETYRLRMMAAMQDGGSLLDLIQPSTRARFNNEQDDYGDNADHSRKV